MLFPKNIFHAISFLAFFINFSFAQTKKEKVIVYDPVDSLVCIKEGDLIIEPNVGFPFFWTYILSSYYDDAKRANLNSSPHIGGKAEYLVTENVGLGIEITWANATMNYQYLGINDVYRVSVSKLRILGKINYHFAVNEEFDVYANAGAGFKYIAGSDNGPSSKRINFKEFNAIPFSIRMSAGCRYFFNPQFGLFGEFGVGGPLLSFGASIKF